MIQRISNLNIEVNSQNISKFNKNSLKTDGVSKINSVTALEISFFAKNMLKKIIRKNKKTQEILESMIEHIKFHPKIGKHLERELIGLRSFASEDREYRLVYYYNPHENYILIHGIGFRKNIYKQLNNILRIKRNHYKKCL